MIALREVITNVAVTLTSWSYFHIERKPDLVSIPQVVATTLIDKVDVILWTSTVLLDYQPFAAMR